MNEKIFRKASIERLSSPEQLDRIITVTSARLWLILIAMGCILTAVILWSVTGKLETTIEADGMLISSGGSANVYSAYEGRILDIRVSPGDYVEEGEIIARLSQEKLVDEISELTYQLKLLQEAHSDQNKVTAIAHQIEELKKELSASSKIISPVQGRVNDVLVDVGAQVDSNTSVISVIKQGDAVMDLIAVIYIPVETGKKLSRGMEVMISPSTVQEEKYGYLKGRVVSISEYPVSVHTAAQKLGSNTIAKSILGNKACLEAIIDLEVNDKTTSGYQWSTPYGPPDKLDNGTVCNASIIVEKQRPIEMVFPKMKNLFVNE